MTATDHVCAGRAGRLPCPLPGCPLTPEGDYWWILVPLGEGLWKDLAFVRTETKGSWKWKLIGGRLLERSV